MLARQRIVVLAATVLAIVCMLPGKAMAAANEQTILMDDDQLIYSSPDHVTSVLERLHALGVDRVKVSVVWLLAAPDSSSTTEPKFDATDPGAYPPGAWDRWDLIDNVAHALGMGVYFQIDPPAPVWAIPHNQPKQGPRLGLAPNPKLFEQFAEAVGRRYSGSYIPSGTSAAGDSTFGPVPAPPVSLLPPPGLTSADRLAADHTRALTLSGSYQAPLPRVNYWGVWNEPNERSWLSPTYRNLGHHHTQMRQPSIYRALFNAAWAGLAATGHMHDTVLIGETANRGILTPADFIRGVYCVSPSGRPLRGFAATLLACPTSGNVSSFVKSNPGLFQVTGYAHHPYAFDYAPNRRYPNPTFFTLDNMGSLESLVASVFGAYGQSRPGGIPLYMTEWGYKTNPPNPYSKTSEAEQAAWLDEGDYMTWRDSYVHALTQFLLVDDLPKAQAAAGTPAYWSTFQTGLLTSDGAAKPSYSAFRIPIWVPHPTHGPNVEIWGQLRPADHSSTQYAVVEFEPQGSNTWLGLTELQTDSTEGYLDAHVSIPAAGSVKLAWLDPNGNIEESRAVSVS